MLKVFNLKYYIALTKMLGIILFLLFVIQLNINYEYSKKVNKELAAENKEMRDNLIAVGGFGLDISETQRMNINELVNIYQQRHSLSEYKWRYKEIGYPLKPKMTYITCEYGTRYINGKWENAKSIDMKQVDSLEIKASISGFARVSKHKVYGNNIVIENLVIMANDFNKPEIKKVKVRLSHLSKIFVEDGQWIKKGEVIGYMGNTGRCAIYDSRLGYYRDITEHERNLGMGMHLDFELRINGYLRNAFATSTFNKQVKL